MKKIILSLMTIISIIFAVGITEAFAETYEDFEYVVVDGEVIIINFKSDDTTVTIPDEIDNLPVTTIDSGAFSSEKKIKKITLPDTITTIGYGAFNYCMALESINIPSSVTTIENTAFGSCDSLAKVYITDMEAWCNIDFEGFSANPFYNETAALYLNNRLTSSITIPEGVTQLKQYAFYGFNKMTSIKIPVSLVSVGKDAFKNCTGITKVTISDIGAWCNIDFYNKYATPLWNGSKLYKESSELKTLTIPDGVTQIKSYAFFGCTSITKVSIPESVTLLGTNTFGKCINLAEAVISAPLTEIPSHTFYECTALEDVNIPETVQVIGNTCFYNCSSLESITIPKSVKKFNSSAFSGCDNLSKVYIEDLAAWCNIDISSKSSHPFQNFGTIYLNNKILKDVVVPEGITQIKNFAFYNCSSIETVTLPSSVTEIGQSAFEWCNSLETITLSEGLITIGPSAFYRCEELKAINFPESLTTIGEYSFRGCVALSEVTLYGNITQIKDSVFSSCESINVAYYLGSQEQYEAMEIGNYNTYLTDKIIFVNHMRTTVSEDKKSITVALPSSVNNGDVVILTLYNGKEFAGVQIKAYQGEDVIFNLTDDYTSFRIMAWNNKSILPSCYDKKATV